MDEKNNIITQETINIFAREKIEIVGVTEVISSTDKEVYAKINGSIMHILGEKLTILKLVPEEKLLLVTGKINGVLFSSKQTKKSFFSKVFK